MTQQEKENILELSGVSKSFKEPHANPFKKRPVKQALVEVDLAIPRHKVTCLLGPNGAGKTTLVKILASLITPDTGTILFNGISLERWDKAIQGKIGLVTPNERSFYWRLTGRRNLEFFGSLYSLGGKVLKDRVEEALAEIGILDAADKPYRLYSTGMKQKLNIARALIGNPDLYLLDEPASHLDPLARGDFWEFISRTLIGKRGATVFLCTHDLDEAGRLADMLVILDKGRVVEKGTLPELHALVSKPEELVMRYGGTLPEPWLSSRGASVSMGEPGCIRLDLGAAGMDQEEAIRTFVQEGGALFEAYRSRIDLLELLNKRIRPDE
jgi:ABC-2 type transport system ATP-binding protein